MAQSRLPTQKEWLNPVLKALHAHGGIANNQQIYEWVVKQLALTDEQLAEPARPGKNDKKTRIGLKIDWTKTRLKNAGYVESPQRTVWALTAEGKASKEIDPDDVIKKNKEFYKEKRKGKKREQTALAPDELSSTDVVESESTATDSEHIIESGKDESSGQTHDEIQWLLLSLGKEMGLDLWVATNDRNKSFNENLFSDLPRLQKSLPMPFDSKTRRTIELIDVLWLRGNSIVAAFKIEHTTSIFSGLLRMSDLMTLQPNITINLFIVAPDARREKVKTEINRPTFANARLPRKCRYIPYSKLTSRIEQANIGGFLRYLNPTFLDEIAEDMRR